MKHTLKATLLAAILGLTSTAVFAQRSLPTDIYKPNNAKLVKAEYQGRGEYEVKYYLQGDDVRPLAKRVIEHAQSRGFRIVESEIRRDDTDLKFRRGNRELDVSIELKSRGRIEYKADLDFDRD